MKNSVLIPKAQWQKFIEDHPQLTINEMIQKTGGTKSMVYKIIQDNNLPFKRERITKCDRIPQPKRKPGYFNEKEFIY